MSAGARWACLAAAALLLFIRKTDAFLHPQLWAEDALPFFIDSVYVGPEAFLRGYAGYFHFVPRLIAWAGQSVPFEAVPAFYFGAALLLTLATVALALSPRLALPHRPLLGLLIVAVPHNGEIYLNPTNLHWIGAVALFLTLLKADPRTVGDWLVDGAVVLLVGLSGPEALLLLPFFAARALRRRTTVSWALLALVLVPAAIQFREYLGAPLSPPLGKPFQWLPLAGAIAYQVVLGAFGAVWWAPHVALVPALVGAAVVLGVLAWVHLAAPAPQRWAAAGMTVFALALLGVTLLRVRFDYIAPATFDVVDRYFFLPKLLLLWLLALAADRHHRRGQVAGALLIVALAAGLPSFRFKPAPDLNWEKYCPALRAGQEVKIPVLPGWEVSFPAREVR